MVHGTRLRILNLTIFWIYIYWEINSTDIVRLKTHNKIWLMRTEFGLKMGAFVQPNECFSFTKLSNFSKMSVRRFIFKSHLLYWTRNTQTAIANGGEKNIHIQHHFYGKKKMKKKFEGRSECLNQVMALLHKRQKFDINRTNVRLLSISYFSGMFLLCSALF